jgi:excisionase family DNA binding protein
MQHQAMTQPADQPRSLSEADRAQWRRAAREITLQSALRKRAEGVPTYSVPEAAALLSVSQEHLYRLIRAEAFPAVPMGIGLERGHYVVPAVAVEEILNKAAGSSGRSASAVGDPRGVR